MNLYARLALNLLGLHATVLRCYDRLAARSEPYPDPIQDFRDLLVFATAAFFDRDPEKNFWHMDEFLGLQFEPCLDRLLAALRAGEG